MRLSRQHEAAYVTIVTFEEQLRGWLASIAQARTSEKRLLGYKKLRELLEDYCLRRIADFDFRADAEFQRLVKGKLRIGTMDLKIAAIALVHRALLLSRNLADFRKVPGLRVEDWTA